MTDEPMDATWAPSLGVVIFIVLITYSILWGTELHYIVSVAGLLISVGMAALARTRQDMVDNAA